MRITYEKTPLGEHDIRTGILDGTRLFVAKDLDELIGKQKGYILQGIPQEHRKRVQMFNDTLGSKKSLITLTCITLPGLRERITRMKDISPWKKKELLKWAEQIAALNVSNGTIGFIPAKAGWTSHKTIVLSDGCFFMWGCEDCSDGNSEITWDEAQSEAVHHSNTNAILKTRARKNDEQFSCTLRKNK